MTTETRRSNQALLGALLVCLALIGMALLGAGCAGGLRKTLSSVTASAVLAAEVTRDACRVLATTTCQTNPCPALEKCHRAEGLIVQGAKALTEGAALINEVVP